MLLYPTQLLLVRSLRVVSGFEIRGGKIGAHYLVDWRLCSRLSSFSSLDHSNEESAQVHLMSSREDAALRVRAVFRLQEKPERCPSTPLYDDQILLARQTRPNGYLANAVLSPSRFHVASRNRIPPPSFLGIPQAIARDGPFAGGCDSELPNCGFEHHFLLCWCL